MAVDGGGGDAGGELVGQPAADVERPDAGQRQVPEAGEDVPCEVALVGGQRLGYVLPGVLLSVLALGVVFYLGRTRL